MPRVRESELARLKTEISVQRLVEAAGVMLKRGGKDLLGRCSFHEDDTASLVVTPAKNLWHWTCPHLADSSGFDSQALPRD